MPKSRQEASITWCDLLRPKFGQEMRKCITSHDVLEPLKQVLSASRDVIISGQICGLNRGIVFTLGDGCWLPKIASDFKCNPLEIRNRSDLKPLRFQLRFFSTDLECLFIIWSAANGDLRDGGLSKSEEIWRERPFSSVFWIFQVLFAPSGKGRKRQKKGEKGQFRPISRKGSQTPLKPPFVTPPFAAAQIVMFVRNFGRVCSQFWLSVRNSVWGPFNRNSRGNPSLCWLGGVKGHNDCEQNVYEQTGVSYFNRFRDDSAAIYGVLYDFKSHDFFFAISNCCGCEFAIRTSKLVGLGRRLGGPDRSQNLSGESSKNYAKVLDLPCSRHLWSDRHVPFSLAVSNKMFFCFLCIFWCG